MYSASADVHGLLKVLGVVMFSCIVDAAALSWDCQAELGFVLECKVSYKQGEFIAA